MGEGKKDPYLRLMRAAGLNLSFIRLRGNRENRRKLLHSLVKKMLGKLGVLRRRRPKSGYFSDYGWT